MNATGGQAITGTCTHINDAPAAAACPIQKRFYTPGQCVSVYIAGCLLDTKGVCHEQHLYSDAAARTSQLQWARDWMIIVMVTLGAIFLVCLSANAAPYYAKSDMDHDQWWLPTQAFALVPALILQLVGLGLNRWSSMNNLDAMHYFSPFGEWSQYNQLTMYSCHDTNPGADLDLCRVLPAAAILAAIGAVLAATCAFFYLASACACAIWADDDDWMLKPVDT
ncbi:hypothetical protein, partial [Dyella sp.]|uniref:hypothetical protein n=1 Tax=Dyella sp. TaxID=1869338 RepID=UPI00284A6B6D